MKSILQPTKPKDRIVQIDILRGFALFGVLFVNVFGYNSSFFDFGGFNGGFTDSLNSGVYHFMINYAADKFIGLFSFLFGIGFAIMYLKYKSDEQRFFRLYARRLLILMLIGIVHIIFFWAGDILLIYGLLGMLLLLVRKLPSSLLLIISVFLYIFPVVYIALYVVFPFLPDALSSASDITMAQVIEIYSKGSISEVFTLRLSEYFAMRNLNILYYMPKILSLFILGFLFYKHEVLRKINQSKVKYFIWGIILLCSGILINIFTVDLVNSITGGLPNPYDSALYTAVFEFVNVILSMSYLFIILFLSSNSVFQKILNPLQYAGRMSLTNYLADSVVFSILMYSYGFGRFGSFELWQLIIFAIVFFAIQIMISKIILQHFRYGPMEWLWRKGTYAGKWNG